MKNYLIAAPLLLMLGACGFDKPPPAEDNQQQSEPVAENLPTKPARPDEASAAEDPARKRLEQFAKQLAADGKGHFRYNRLRDAEEGGKERQVYVEMVGMTDAQAADAAAKILVDLGYKQGRRWGDENGVRIRFLDVGNIPVSVLVRSREAHPLLNHEDSTSSVYLTRPVGE